MPAFFCHSTTPVHCDLFFTDIDLQRLERGFASTATPRAHYIVKNGLHTYVEALRSDHAAIKRDLVQRTLREIQPRLLPARCSPAGTSAPTGARYMRNIARRRSNAVMAGILGSTEFFNRASNVSRSAESATGCDGTPIRMSTACATAVSALFWRTLPQFRGRL